MEKDYKIKMFSITLDCKEPLILAEFYKCLLDWDIKSIGEEWIMVYNPKNEYKENPCILFQKNNNYIPPVWPEKMNMQQQMAHIDFTVSNLDDAVQHALNCGAVLASKQYSDEWKVMIDPAGHPFCLCL